MRDDIFTTTSGILNLHPTKGTHWVMFVNEFYFVSYGCPPPTNILNHIKKGNYSEYQIQKNDSYCAAYGLYVLYLTQTIGLKNAVLNLYYQTFKIIERRKLIIIQLKIKLSQNNPRRIKIEIIQKIQQSWLRVASRIRKSYQKIGKNL